ncbi:MAG: hypothetical protein LAP85_27310 [Acidobacteriia bacterium]|nr:hypothetical protein [Terriglobia bacterium]
MNADLRELYRSFPTPRLREIAASDTSEYRIEAIEAAQAELDMRGESWRDESVEAEGAGREESDVEAGANETIAKLERGPWLKWEEIGTQEGPHTMRFYRAKLPGGWLVYACEGPTEGDSVWNYRLSPSNAAGLTYIPDSNHEWDGGSMP